jgi:beta-lactamase regulating signal transducer with metallopeptidase domain
MTISILVNAALRMLLFCAAAWLVIHSVRLRNPHTEALIWRMALLAGLVLPVLLSFRMAPSVVTQLQLPVLTVDRPGAPGAAASAALAGWVGRTLVAIYCGMALLLLVRLAAGLLGLWRICRSAERLPFPQDVRVSKDVHSPATFGSVVLLPVESGSWPSGKLDAILAHELAHVRARDSYWSWLAQLHHALFWFAPHAWWLRRQLASLAETTSDDAVVAARHDPVAYADLLLEFARCPNHRSVAMSVAESNVPKRIERLLARIPPARELPRVARWAAVALLIPAVMLAATTTRAASTAKPESARLVADGRVGIVRPAVPDDYYPAVASAEQVEGIALLEVDLDVLGQLVDARVVEVEPADPRYGFADAALLVARNSTYMNTRQQPASFRFKVKFALDDK